MSQYTSRRWGERDDGLLRIPLAGQCNCDLTGHTSGLFSYGVRVGLERHTGMDVGTVVGVDGDSVVYVRFDTDSKHEHYYAVAFAEDDLRRPYLHVVNDKREDHDDD
jgi:hypothetical protein